MISQVNELGRNMKHEEESPREESTRLTEIMFESWLEGISLVICEDFMKHNISLLFAEYSEE